MFFYKSLPTRFFFRKSQPVGLTHLGIKRIYPVHDAPVVRFLPKLGREISHGLFFASGPPQGCDVSFLAKCEIQGVAWWSYLGRRPPCH